LIGDYLECHVSKPDLAQFHCNPNDPTTYARCPWYSNDAICKYYKENIVSKLVGYGIGSGISVKPECVEYAGVSTNAGPYAGTHQETNEWIIAWAKPSYDNEIIGVYSRF
jgi:hypothetical protein